MFRVVYGDDPSVSFFLSLFYKSARLNFKILDFIASYSHVSVAINADSKRRMEIARVRVRLWFSLITKLVSTYLRTLTLL